MSNNKFDSRQSELRTALPMIGSAANDTLDTIFPLINAEIAKLFEDRNTILTGGGVLFVNATANSLSMSSALTLHINSLVAGGAPKIIDLSSTTRAFTSDGNMLYAIVDRIAETATVVADAATLPTVASANQEIVLIAKRVGSNILFRNGLVIPAGRSTQLTGQSSEYLQPAVVNDGATTGANATAAAFTAGIIRLTNSSLVSLSGLPAGGSGQIVIVENQTGNAITINDDEATATSSNRIRTGTAGNVQMLANATFIFTYDATSAKWMLTGGSGSGSGSGGINYIPNPSAEAGLQGTATYADSPGVAPVDGTGGVPFVTLARSTVAPLTGLASYIFTKDAVNRQGQGFSMDFVIDAGYQGQQMAINYLYQIMSGTFVTGDVSLWIVDVTNNVVIQPSASQIVNTSTAQPAQPLTFQTAPNSVNYRLCFHVSSASALAYSIKLDNISVGPQIATVGQTGIIGEIIATGSTTSPANYLYCNGAAVSRTQYAELFNQIGTRYGSGDGSTTFNLPDLRGRFLRGTSDGTGRDPNAGSRTAMAAGGLTGDVPGSVQLDAVQGHNHNSYGAATVNQGAGGLPYGFFPVAVTSPVSDANVATSGVLSNVIRELVTNGSNGTPRVASETRPLNANVAYHICFRSGVLMSSDASTRAISFDATGATSVHTGLPGKMTGWNVNVDLAGGWDSVNSRYVIRAPGSYKITITGSVNNTAYSSGIYLYLNGVSGRRVLAYSLADVVACPTVNAILNLKTGDYIEGFMQIFTPGAVATATESTTCSFSVELIQGPAQIQASTIIALRYLNTAGTAIPNGTTQIGFATRVFDTTGGAWNGSQFTAPAPGYYKVSASMNGLNGSYAAGQNVYAQVKKNGTIVGVGPHYLFTTSAGSATVGASVDCMVQCNTNDVITIEWVHGSALVGTLRVDAGYNSLDISRLNGVN